MTKQRQVMVCLSFFVGYGMVMKWCSYGCGEVMGMEKLKLWSKVVAVDGR